MPSGTFRVEVLLPNRLDLIDLGHLVKLFEPGSPEATAVTKLRGWYDEACSRVAKRDYGRLLAELKKSSDIDEDAYALLSEKERKRAFRVAFLVREHSLDYERLTDSYLSLVALWGLGKSFNRIELLEFLSSQSWGVKHEVLARWGWMQEHRKLLAKNAKNPLHHPFLCHVAGRNKPGRRTDKEFSQLVRFLHALRATAGQELLFLKKGETPDFVLEDIAGKPVGVEMSEVPLSKSWAQEQDDQAKVLDCLRPQLEEKGLLLHILYEPKSWRALLERLSTLEAWFSAELVRISKPKEPVTIWNKELDLSMQVKASYSPCIMISSLSSAGSAELQEETRLMARSIYDWVRAKIWKVGKSGTVPFRKSSSVRPCHLVLYPNHGTFLKIEAAVEMFIGNLDFDITTHFDAVWLSTENMIQKVWPVR